MSLKVVLGGALLPSRHERLAKCTPQRASDKDMEKNVCFRVRGDTALRIVYGAGVILTIRYYHGHRTTTEPQHILLVVDTCLQEGRAGAFPKKA